MRQAWQRLISLASSDLMLKLFSLLFAFGLWLFVNAGQKTSERAMDIPVELRNIPSDLMVANPSLDQIEVRVMGPPALLSTLGSEHLKVALDLEGSRPGVSTFRLSPESFNPPRGVRITRISPSVVSLRLEAVTTRNLPVAVQIGEKVPYGYKVARVEVNPETVRVQGPASEVNRLASAATVPLGLEGVRDQVTRELRLTSAGKPISFFPDRVVVSVTLEEEWITREFSRVEIKGNDLEGKYKISPSRGTLRLSGPKRLLGQLQLSPENVYLNLKGLRPGQHTLPWSFNLPSEIKVLEQRPERFRVRVQAP